MGIDVLGPLVVDGTERIGPRDRVVLQVLVVKAGEFVSPEVIADALWGETVPASWTKVVQGCIARLRKALTPGAIETSANGYRLETHDDLLDVRRFELLVSRARRHLDDGEPDRAAYVAGEALSLWRGRALPDVVDWEPGHVESERLDGLRMDAQELRVAAEVVVGRSRHVLEDARTLVAEAPYREVRWELFARALYQSGRQSEALQVLQRARKMLRDDLGLEPGEALVALQQAILRQDPDLSTAPMAPPASACPYRGLLPYEAEDADAFFGRDGDVAAALQRLRERGVLAVVGASGTGKSSVVRAGIVSALRHEGTLVVVTTPGSRPTDSLAGVPSDGRAVLVVDQAEEAVTLCPDNEERAAYLRTLAAYAGPLILVLRADRLAELSAVAGIARLIEAGLFLLADLDEDHLRAAIEGPARQAGLRLEPGLVDLLVRDVAGEPGALPLLSHVLRQTWEHREGSTLTVDRYRATGGVRNAVAQSAETLYEGLETREREQLRALLMRLVMPSNDGEPVRARVPRAKVATDAEHERLVESLVAARLLSSDEGDLQIAHEALAREWPRLRGWLEEDVEGQRIFRHLAAAAEEWDHLDRPSSELYRGVRLAAASDWAAHHVPEMTATERAFLDASRTESERELHQQRRSNRRLRGALAGIAALLIASLVVGSLAVRERNHARGNEHRTLAALASSDAHRIALSASSGNDPSQDLLLAVEANRLEDSPTTRSAVLKVLVGEDHLAHVTSLGNDAAVSDVAVSPDGRELAIGSYTANPGLMLVDAATGKVMRTYSPAVTHVMFLGPNRLAVGLDQSSRSVPLANPLRLLDAHTLKQEPTQLGGQGPAPAQPTALTAAPDRAVVAADVQWSTNQGSFSKISAWNLARPGRPVFTRNIDRFASVLAVTGNKVILGQDGQRTLNSFDLGSGRRQGSLNLQSPTALNRFNPSGALSPDGRTEAVALGNDVVLVDTTKLRVLHRWIDVNGTPNVPAFSRDGTRLLTGDLGTYGSGFTVWRVPDGEELATIKAAVPGNSVATLGASDGTAYLAGADGLMTWRLDRPVTGVQQIPIQTWGRGVNLRLGSPDGRMVIGFDSGGARSGHFLAQVQDIASGRIVASFQYPKSFGPDAGNTATWSPDSRFVAATQGGRVHSFDIHGGHSMQGPDLGFGDLADVMYLSPTQILVASTGTIAAVDARTLRLDRILAHTNLTLTGFSFSADRRHILVYDTNGDYYALDPRGHLTGLPLGQLSSAAVSPDGSRVAVTRGGDGAVGLYDLRRHRWISQPTPAGESYVNYSLDGDRFVTEGDNDSTLRAWDGRTGRLEVSLDPPGPCVCSAMVFQPHSHDVLLSGYNGELLRWDPDTRDLIANACRLAGRNLTPDEWNAFIGGNRPYRRTCPQYPAGIDPS